MECFAPFLVTPSKHKDVSNIEKIPVPCGKCPACYKRRVSQWSFRLMQEEKHSTSAYFITLTYDTKHVPITDNGFMAISKRDVQLFLKRLRKAHTAADQHQRLVYYVCGEYGGRTMRPHYHMLLFNADLTVMLTRSNIRLLELTGFDGKNHIPTNQWQLGSTTYGRVTAASVGYSLKYMSKLGVIPIHKNDDRQPEFALMSKGIGDVYLTKAMVKWHLSDKYTRMYCTTSDGKKICMPRYYKNKIYSEEMRKVVGLKTRAKMLKEFELKYHGKTKEERAELIAQNYRSYIAAGELHKQNSKKDGTL